MIQPNINDPHSPICPYLGLLNDPGTSFINPSSGNYCFNCKTPAVPNLIYQEAFCLVKAHENCGIFTKSKREPFPPAIAMPIAKPSQFLWLGRYLFNVIVILLLVGLVWVGFTNMRNNSSQQAQQLPEPMILAVTQTATLQPTETFIPPTETPIPSPTLTPGPTAMVFPPQIHNLETPIIVGDKTFFIHRVLDGEILETLARKYQTTVDILKSINYQLPSRIWSHSLLVISPNLGAPDPNLPTFSPYQVVDLGIKIEDLATNLKVDATQLKYYNRISDGTIVNKGDWLLIPRSAK